MNKGCGTGGTSGSSLRVSSLPVAVLSLGILAAAPTGSDHPLISAVKDGLEDPVKTLLKTRANVNAADSNGSSALAWAVMRDNIAIAALLLKAKADPNTADVNAITPLRIAVDNHSLPMAKLLVEHGANPNIGGPQGETPLMVAVHHGLAEMVELLLEHKADPNARESQFGQTALMWAARDSDLVRLLLAHGADAHAVTRSWEVTSPIYTPPTATLGVTGIPWNHEGEFTVKAGGLSALLFAAQNENIEAVRLILDAGVDVNQPSADGTTALLTSLYNWQPAGVVTFFNPGAGMKFSPNFKIAALLLDRGAKVRVTNGSGYTPLHALLVTMAPVGRGAGGRGVLARAAAANRTPAAPVPPAPPEPASEAEKLQLVKRMLEMGADPNLPTIYPTAGPVASVRINPLPQGSTPFHAAGVVPNAALIELLASYGANPNIVRKDGHTPFTVAVMADNLAAVKAMVAHGADLTMTYNPADKLADPVEPKAQIRRNQTALHIAAAAGASQVAGFLAEQGVSLDARNDRGETALQLANHQEVYRYKKQKEGPLGFGDPNAVRSTATSDAIRKAMENATRRRGAL
jgi:ankyrin repeat protein